MKVAIILDPEFQALIPPLAPEEFAQLEANLLADGCRDPLVTWKGILLDGHNRYRICQTHGLPFETVAMEFPDREAAADWMDANQLGRRNLTPDQRSILRGRRYNRTKKTMAQAGAMKGKSSLSQSDTSSPENMAQTLGKQHGVSRATIIRDGKRAEFIERLAATEPEAAQAVRDGTRRLNEVKRTARVAKVKEAASLPDAKYRVLYADPPWKYGDQLTESYGSTRFHYPAMSISELCKMPIQALCEKDAVLFLWVTSPLLEESFAVIAAWGFKYKSSFVWDKVKHNMGHYNSVRHEFLLICTRGSCVPDKPKLFDSVQESERSAKHSEKPRVFREIIETIYPHGKRLELFAREEVKGWDRWGNQA